MNANRPPIKFELRYSHDVGEIPQNLVLIFLMMHPVNFENSQSLILLGTKSVKYKCYLFRLNKNCEILTIFSVAFLL